MLEMGGAGRFIDILSYGSKRLLNPPHKPCETGRTCPCRSYWKAVCYRHLRSDPPTHKTARSYR